jgi:hypothetical protein
MYETGRQPLLPRSRFYQRVAAHVAVAMGLIALSLVIGMVGYMATTEPPMSAVDAFLNSAMLLGGMGPVTTLHDTSAKIFAGLFALYAGLMFVACTALLLAPLLHRILHRFHMDDKS